MVGLGILLSLAIGCQSRNFQDCGPIAQRDRTAGLAAKYLAELAVDGAGFAP